MNEKELLRIYIDITGTDEISSKNAHINMIHFVGQCTGDFFNGEILPGGTDTQVIRPDKESYLSARYCMVGKDRTGAECRIFIENKAKFEENGISTTEPRIYTDSEDLAWLETIACYGEILDEDGKLVISIRTKEPLGA